MNFINSGKNASDVQTKNVTEKIHNTFVKMFHDGTLGHWLQKLVDREAVETDENERAPEQSDIIKGRDLIPGGNGTEEVLHVRSMTGISRINQIYNGVPIECGYDTYNGELIYLSIVVRK